MKPITVKNKQANKSGRGRGLRAKKSVCLSEKVSQSPPRGEGYASLSNSMVLVPNLSEKGGVKFWSRTNLPPGKWHFFLKMYKKLTQGPPWKYTVAPTASMKSHMPAPRARGPFFGMELSHTFPSSRPGKCGTLFQRQFSRCQTCTVSNVPHR